MRPPLAAVIAAHGVLRERLADLDDARVAEPSSLPGWSRGHVLAHLTDNARMFARLADHSMRDELVETYEGGVDERNAIIEAAAGRSAAEHRRALAEQTARLEASWATAGDRDWSRPVLFRNADIAATVFARWREVWIHLVDLDLGVRPAEWPDDLAAHAIDFLLIRLPAGTSLRAADSERRWSTGGGPGPVVTGEVRDLAAWLAGREPAVPPTSPSGLPDLGPWPPHPARPAGPAR